MQMKICKKCKRPIYRRVYEQDFIKRTQFTVLSDGNWNKVRRHYECSIFKHICEYCGKEFITRDSRPRKYCSHKCAAERNPMMKGPPMCIQIPIDETMQRKQCPACGAIFHRKRYSNGILMPTRDWNKQKYCSRSCAAERFNKG